MRCNVRRSFQAPPRHDRNDFSAHGRYCQTTLGDSACRVGDPSAPLRCHHVPCDQRQRLHRLSRRPRDNLPTNRSELVHARPSVSPLLGLVYVAVVSWFHGQVDTHQELTVSLLVFALTVFVRTSRDVEYFTMLEATRTQ